MTDLPSSTPAQRPARPALPVAARLVLGLAALTIIGTLVLLLPGVATDGQLTLREAMFTAVSALTVTGLSVITPARDLTLLGQTLLLVMMQIGGVGFMVIAVVTLRLVGRRVSLNDRLALRDSLGLLDLQSITRLTWNTLRLIFLIETVGALLLWLQWRPLLGDGLALFYGAFHSVAAFCNAGFDLFSGLEQFPLGMPTDFSTLTVLSSLIVIGGLGIPVVADLLMWPGRRRLTLHTRLTLTVSVLLIVGGAAGIFLGEAWGTGVLSEETLGRQVALAVFHSISARTAGFLGLPNFDQLTPSSHLLTMVLMFIGSAPASMGGGITTGTFTVLALSLWSLARGKSTVDVGGRSISMWVIRRAAAVLTVSLLVVTLATWLILVTHPHVTLDDAAFEVVSAFATCGLTLAFTQQLNLLGELIIMFVMFWGRLGALTIIIALAYQGPPPAVTYPEEQVFIG